MKFSEFLKQHNSLKHGFETLNEGSDIVSDIPCVIVLTPQKYEKAVRMLRGQAFTDACIECGVNEERDINKYPNVKKFMSQYDGDYQVLIGTVKNLERLLWDKCRIPAGELRYFPVYQFKAEIENGSSQIQKDIEKIQAEFDSETKELNAKIDDITNQIEKLKTERSKLQKELKDKTKAINNKIEYLKLDEPSITDMDNYVETPYKMSEYKTPAYEMDSDLRASWPYRDKFSDDDNYIVYGDSKAKCEEFARRFNLKVLKVTKEFMDINSVIRSKYMY